MLLQCFEYICNLDSYFSFQYDFFIRKIMDNGRFYMGTHFMMEDEMIMTIGLFVARKIVMIVTPKFV